jgi:2-amino-4-hydroxy-6-hydroxymethyldihydropteridine diphosphokinase
MVPQLTGIRSKVLLALGGNLGSTIGSPTAGIRHSIGRLPEKGFVIRAVSRFFDTPCFPAGAGPDYVNASVAVETELTPLAALAALHSIEAQLGRERTARWGMRTLDLDMLAYDDLVCPDLATYDLWRTLPPQDQIRATPDQLILPHPRLQDRAFVLVPLADIAPDWVHPVTKKTVTRMLEALSPDDRQAVRPSQF